MSEIHAASESITAENTFSDPIQISGKFNLSISGTFVGTVTVQRKRLNESTYRDVESYTTETEANGEVIGKWDVRVGIKTGDYTSGTAVVSISK